jgi:hypothetical protein
MRFSKRFTANAPAALSIIPSGNFAEHDGLWSTFNISIGGSGENAQPFNVIISTSSLGNWLPLPPSCPNVSSTPANCASTRGVGMTQGVQSTGYDPSKENAAIGVGLTATNLGSGFEIAGSNYTTSVGALWVDSLSLQYTSLNDTTNAIRATTVSAPIFGLNNSLYYLSTMGVAPGISGVTSSSRGQIAVNSTLQSMVNNGIIPSRSWSYTAGAHYGMSSLP